MFSEEFNNNKKNNDCDEENLDCENTADSDMTEGHFESIFVNCDVENTGYVCVSTLLKFMEPFLQENLDELEKIKSLLDPIGIDPKIDKKKFCSEMCKWTEHKKLEESTSPQSTPRLSTSSRTSPLSKFLQCSFEQNLNTTYSCGSTPSPLTHHYFERSLEIQEEIDNLKQQNRKLNDDLQDLQSQLLLSEECNINLQADFSRITKRLEVEQQLNQNLQKFQLECEELRESEISLKRDMERLINNNNTLKCENNQLKQNFEELQDEKIQLCEEIELYRTKNNENNRLLFEARYKIDELREQLSLKEDSLKAVEDNFNTFEEKIKDYENTIAFLRAEKEKCKNTSKSEKSFKENIDHTQNIRYIDSNMNIDQNNATINTSYPYPIQDEIVRDMPSTKTLYSMVFDPKVLQNNSLLNELKEVTSDEIDYHIKCSNKIKCLEGALSSLEEEYNLNLNSLKLKDAAIKKYEAQSNELEIIIKSLHSEVKNTNVKILQQENLISEKDIKIHEIQNEMLNLIEISNNLKHEKEILIEEKSCYARKIDGMKEEYEQEIHNLQVNLHGVEINMKYFSEDSRKYHNLKNKLETVTNDLNHVIEKYEVLKRENFDMNSSEENSDDVDIENKISNFKFVIENFKKDYDEKCSLITKLNEQIDKKSKVIADLNKSTLNSSRIEEENRNLKNQLKQKENEFIQQSHLLDVQRNEIEQLKNTLKDFTNLTKEVERLHEIEKVHNQCPRDYVKKLESLQNQCYQQEVEIEKLLKNESSKHQIEMLILENNQLKTDYEEMLISLKHANLELETKVENEQKETEKFKENVVSLKHLVKDLQNELVIIKKNYESLQFHLNELQTENDQLKIEEENMMKFGIQSLEDCTQIEIINAQLQESLISPTSSRKIVENTICKQCLHLKSEISKYEIICAKQQQHLDQLQSEYHELNPRPDVPRLKQDWSKINPLKKSHRIIEKLQHQLEAETIKNEELCKLLEKNKSDKSQTELQMAQNDHVVKYQEEIAKFKSYLEETSTYLKNLTRKICSQSTSIENIFVGWEEDKSTVPLKKERYYENHYYNFNRNLSRCIFLLMNRDKITKEISHKSTQMSPDSLRDGKSYERTLSSLPPTHTITLQPSKLSHHHSNFNQHHSAPPTPKLRSKFGYRSQSPEISGGFAGYNEKQTMAEPCSFETPKLDVQLNKAIIEMNNNVSPDSPAALVYPTVPTVSINRNNQNKNENNVIPSSSHMESKVESTTSNEVSGNNVYVPDTPEIHVPEIRHENWSNIMRRFSNMSISASSTNSGSTESLSIDNEHTLNGEDRHQLKIALDMAIANRNSEHTQSLQATPATDNEKITTDALRRRSKSERSHEEPEQIESFPSIPDTLLEDLNLLTKPEEESKEDLCEQDEIERKFMALSLAFMTDGTTLTTRRERLQKFRDQAEKNLLSEVEQLMAAIHKLNPLCIDAERTELVTSLITQVDVLKKAAKQSWNMSQCFGAVQQEWRLNESVKLMLKYVESVKLQRDTARRHFQYTRRMLQETTSAETPKTSTQPKTVLSNSSNSSSNSNNSRLMTRRRASIATISRPATPTETLRTLANRRPSPSHTDPIVRRLELPERLSPAIIRSTRQSRAELGVGVEQLQNIRENMEAESSDVSDYECSEVSSKTTNRLNNTESSQINDTCAPNPYALMVCNFFRRYCGDSLHSSGLLHEICVTGALVFFFIAAMQLGSVLLEVEYARRGVSVNHIPWSWANWDEVLQVLFNWNSSNDNGPRPY